MILPRDMTKFFIGTSGWFYSHWKGVFYPQDLPASGFLNYYLTKFRTVEINSSFYHLPKEQTFKNWHQKTPNNFLFSLKASRFISHRKKLKDCLKPWKLFYSRAKLLEKKLGPILFQLAPSFKADKFRLKDFLKILPKNQRFAFEFRHQSWFCQSIFEILRKFKIALVVADTPSYPLVKKITTDFIYLRLHGHEKLYASNYSEASLKKWARLIKKWLKEFDLKAVYIYFDNDAQGFAPQNAASLKKLLY